MNFPNSYFLLKLVIEKALITSSKLISFRKIN